MIFFSSFFFSREGKKSKHRSNNNNNDVQPRKSLEVSQLIWTNSAFWQWINSDP